MSDKPGNGKFFIPLTLTISFLGIWQALSFFLPPSVLASPWQVASIYISEFPLLFPHLATTLAIAAIGAAVGLFAGMMAGYFLYRSARIARYLLPLLSLSQTVPLMFLYPLLLLWLGFGPFPRLAVVGLGTFFPVALGYFHGLSGVETEVLNLFRAMGLSRKHLFRHVIFPGSLSRLLQGIQLASVYILPSAVVGEWLGARSGLGVYMLRAYKSFRIDRVTAAIVLVSLLSWFLWKASRWAEAKTVFWENKEKRP